MAFSSVLFAGDNPPKNVLVLHSYHRGLLWNDAIDEGIGAVFNESDLDIEVQTEYMDTKRIHNPRYLQQLRGIYKTKFDKRAFDVIISTDNNALNFLLKHHHELFPQTPVVFCGVNNYQDAMLTGDKWFTGAVESLDMREILDTVLELHPETKQIVMYGSNTPTYFANKKYLSRLIPDYEGRVGFRFVEGRNIKEVQDDIGRLPDNRLILIISSIRDEQGIPLPFRVLPGIMTSVRRIPIYGCWDFLLGHGIVGGKLISGFAQGETAAKMALRVLHGEKVENIPVLKKSPNRFMFDYNQMMRFGLNLSDLPGGSILINKPSSFYSQYKGWVWTAIIAVSCLLLFIVGLGINIVRRKRTEAALRKSEERYRTLFKQSRDAIAIVRQDGTIIDANGSFSKLFGYEREELMQRNAKDLWADPVERSGWQEEMKEKGFVANYDWKVRRKDGEVRDCLLTSTERRAADGALQYQTIARDITDQKKSVEALRQSEKRFRDLFDSMTDMVYTQDLKGRFLSANPALNRVFGYVHNELIGLKAMDFMKPELRNQFESEYLKTLEAQGHYEGITSYFTRDGRKIYLEHRNNLVRPEMDAPYVSGMARDVTHRILAERQIKGLQEQMRQAEKMEAIGVLAGGIAHDFNNLLMGIQGNASLMGVDIDAGHSHHEKLKNIEQYVRNGADLTQQLLGFASGGKYEVKPTDLNRLIKNESRLFGRTKKEIRIHENYDEALRIVAVDRGQMAQIMLNLHINAWQAMPGGGDLYVETENVMLDEDDAKRLDVAPGKYVKISVADTGVGMDEATRRKIFDPFFTTKKMDRGTGLGLASVYGIIKNHGGGIAVDSAKGEGSCFSIYLPAEEAVGRAPTVESGKEVEIVRGSQTILLVDDEEMILDVARQMMEEMGYLVLTAKGGKEAVEVYEKEKDRIDMVALDMIMPDMGGGETYNRLKEINPDVKVLLSSGYSLDGQAREILDRGCSGFIQKPFRLKRLSQKLREILDS